MLRVVQKLRILPRWIVVILDLSIIAFSALLAYILRFNFVLSDLIRFEFHKGVFLATLCGLVSILISKSYKGIVRYTGLQDGLRIIYTSLISMGLTIFANWAFRLTYGVDVLPNSVIIITFLSSLLLLFYYRLLVKSVFAYYRRAVTITENVAVFGAGQSGIVTKHVIDHDSTLKVVVFLEDNSHMVGNIIDGTRISDGKELTTVIRNYSISQLVISDKDLSVERKNEIVDTCLKLKVKVRSVPPVEKWVHGELSMKQIKEVKITDLLGRDTITLDKENIKRELRGRRVCITGAAGSIGSEITRQVLKFGPSEVILIDQAESALYDIERELKTEDQITPLKFYIADVTNKERIASIFEETQPEILYHAAAYKHVPMMESNPVEAIYTNVFGTKVVADLCVDFKVRKFVFISTDKAVNPTNVMGASKRIAEIYTQSLNNYLIKTGKVHTQFITTRFGNVLGSNGSVIPYFTKQIAAGGPVTVTHPDINRYFMTIPEACQLVLEAGSMAEGGEIYIFDMGKAVKVLDLAKKMIRLSGLEPGRDIEIVFTGLRQGEKLYEELLNNEENTVPTYHNKIMIAKVAEYSYQEVEDLLSKLNKLLDSNDEMGLVSVMKEIVPEYVSNYSRFEILDDKEKLEKAV